MTIVGGGRSVGVGVGGLVNRRLGSGMIQRDVLCRPSNGRLTFPSATAQGWKEMFIAAGESDRWLELGDACVVVLFRVKIKITNAAT